MKRKAETTQTALLLTEDVRAMIFEIEAKMGMSSMTAVIELAVRYYYRAVVGKREKSETRN